MSWTHRLVNRRALPSARYRAAEGGDVPDREDHADDADLVTDDGAASGTPRWVKVSGTLALVVFVLFVVLLISGRGGGHGPGRHSGDAPTPASTVAEPGRTNGHTRPSEVTHADQESPP